MICKKVFELCQSIKFHLNHFVSFKAILFNLRKIKVKSKKSSIFIIRLIKELPQIIIQSQQKMISFRNIAFLTRIIRLQPKQMASFADSWKERDEAAEKVYITRAEKQTMKKLLKKIEVEEEDMESNLEEFQRRLREVMRRYKIENETLASEIINLHRQTTQ